MSEFDQSNLDLSTETPSGPVECLGKTFESDDARREHYTELSREKLKDPEFRKIEGFPIGEDEDILALSDPPYYTACPNPWIEDFIKHHGRPYDPNEKYHREPFAADVSEGKHHPIYKSHSYHTKVPHRAIMRYILHYTEPGDLIFDGFCGTGMTGVAAQLCGSEKEIRELGYQINHRGEVLNESGNVISKIGTRKAILTDLSPIASFITYNYNTPADFNALDKEALGVLKSLENDYSWMYETLDKRGEKCKINYVIWSDVFLCSECGEDLIFWRDAVSKVDWKVKDEFLCPKCSSINTKKTIKRKLTNIYDESTKKVTKRALQVPALISYKSGKHNELKEPDSFDYDLVEEINLKKIDSWYPIDELPPGSNTSQPKTSHGISKVDQFFTHRALTCISAYANKVKNKRLLVHLTSTLRVASKLYRLTSQGGSLGAGGGPMNGTLYVPSLIKEIPFLKLLREHIKRANKTRYFDTIGDTLSFCSSITQLDNIQDNSLDYVFLDPPFGSNINYSELNFLWESWLKIKTNNVSEAIENKVQNKSLGDYRKLMLFSFREVFRKLKPGRWLTVEFSNTNSTVWNSIQSSLTESGFIVANVAALDKKQGSFKAVTTTTAVKQDLVISAYKPSKQLELIFTENGDSVGGVWQFIDLHLKQLPVSKPKGGSLEFVAERDPRILYDRMVAFYIGHNTPVPLSSGEFQAALDDKYPARDGMVFLPEQVAEYDKLAAKMESVGQMVVFVEDEKSAIGWLRQYLKDKPSTYQGIHPDFTQQLSASWRKFETRPELSVLLDQNFLKYSGEGDVPIQISSHLSKYYTDLTLEKLKRRDDPKLQAKAKDRWYVPDPKKMADVEAQREKKLLAEFWEYAAQAGVERGQTQTSQTNLPLGDSLKKKPKVKKLKEVRTDAVRAGFMECQRNNQGAVILAVAEVLPANVIEEDEQLQMIYDMAEMRAG